MRNELNRAFRTTVCGGAPLLLIGAALAACEMLTSVEQLKADATAALAARNYGIAVHNAKRWSDKTADQYEAFFVMAQAQAQAGDMNAALLALEQAIKKGLRDDLLIDTNANLAPVRDMSAYKTLMKAQFPDGKLSEAAAEQGKRGNMHHGGEVSITEKDGQQVLRAGDVEVRVPENK